MPFNATDFYSNPFGAVFSTWTDLFEHILGPGAGNVFWLVPILVFSYAVYLKTDDPMMGTVMLMGGCALLGSGSIFTGAIGAGLVFILITALAMTGMITRIIFQKRG
jgi:hypothetical protein